MLTLELLFQTSESLSIPVKLYTDVLSHDLQVLPGFGSFLITIPLQTVATVQSLGLVTHSSRVLGLRLNFLQLTFLDNMCLNLGQMFFSSFVRYIIQGTVFLLCFLVMVLTSEVQFLEIGLTFFALLFFGLVECFFPDELLLILDDLADSVLFLYFQLAIPDLRVSVDPVVFVLSYLPSNLHFVI